MRIDIRACGTFPDHALPDHTETVRRLSVQPSVVDPRREPRSVFAATRQGWDPGSPRLCERRDAGDLAPFHGWDKR
jgi:hypothetical protein